MLAIHSLVASLITSNWSFEVETFHCLVVLRSPSARAFTMGLFNRKNSSKTSNTTLNGANQSNSSLKSPTTQQSSNGFAFNSPSMPDITLPSPPDPTLDPAAYLRSIYAVRARSKLIFGHARRNRLAHFDVDFDKFKETAKYVVSIIKVKNQKDSFMQQPG